MSDDLSFLYWIKTKIQFLALALFISLHDKCNDDLGFSLFLAKNCRSFLVYQTDLSAYRQVTLEILLYWQWSQIVFRSQFRCVFWIEMKCCYRMLICTWVRQGILWIRFSKSTGFRERVCNFSSGSIGEMFPDSLIIDERKLLHC